jgi:cystathionine beta-lyase/cystathionine gamma-synthase
MWCSGVPQPGYSCISTAHSATKYLNGHGDVVAGALCGSAAHIRTVFRGPFMTLGGILSPHDAWLLIRGMRTLEVRLERIQRTTADVAEFLASHPKVRRLYLPGHGVDGQQGLTSSQLSTHRAIGPAAAAWLGRQCAASLACADEQ